jgi:hypothetical protein
MSILENKSACVIRISAGNPVSYTEIAEIPFKGRYKVYVDPNGTYREYIIDVIEMPDVSPLILTPDDMIDFGTIEITVEEGMIKTERKPRDTGRASRGSVSRGSTTMERFKKFLTSVFSF